MSEQLSRILLALCGIFGTILLGLYFGVGFVPVWRSSLLQPLWPRW